MFQDTTHLDSQLALRLITRRLLTTVVIFLFCYGAGSLIVPGQEPPRSSTATPKSNPPSSGRSGSGYRRRHLGTSRPAAGVARGSALEQSDNFVELGDQFAERSRWRAAEVAYKEATTLWQGNSDAWLALGELYVVKTTLAEAYQVYNRLRALDSQMADYLMGEIRAKEKKE